MKNKLVELCLEHSKDHQSLNKDPYSGLKTEKLLKAIENCNRCVKIKE